MEYNEWHWGAMPLHSALCAPQFRTPQPPNIHFQRESKT